MSENKHHAQRANMWEQSPGPGVWREAGRYVQICKSPIKMSVSWNPEIYIYYVSRSLEDRSTLL